MGAKAQITNTPGQPVPVAGPAVFETLFTAFAIGTGAAYADKDAMGTEPTPVKVPVSGKITGMRYFDIDYEGLPVTSWIFSRKPTIVQVDNAQFDISDQDLAYVIAPVDFADFSDAKSGQVSVQTGLDLDYVAPEGILWVHLQARGVLNIAAGKFPYFKLVIRPDREA